MDKENKDSGKKDNTLIYESEYIGEKRVKLVVSSYACNNAIYLGLEDPESEYEERWCDITVNLNLPIPPYFGFLDVNNFPKVREFVEKYNLGKYTVTMGRSGFCAYPLYCFNKERLEELCPEQVAEYEQMLECLIKEAAAGQDNGEDGGNA